MVDRFEKFTFAISEIYRCWRKIATDEMEKYGLKGACASYIVTLSRYDEGLTSAQLCELSGKNKADVSRAVADMESKGLIVREVNGKNLYRAKLILTDMGKAAAGQICERAKTAVELGGKGLNDAQRINFYETLDIIASNLLTMSKEGLPKE